MINRILEECETSVQVISKTKYEKTIKDKYINIKGKSAYEDYILVEDLPRNKEFYVLEDYYESYPDGGDSWNFVIATTYKGMYFIISAWGGN